MVYVNYIDGEIVRKELPVSLENVSGFNKASDEFKTEHNWYKLVEVNTPTKEYEIIKSFTTELVGIEVIKTYELENIDLETYKNTINSRIKETYNQLSYEGFECSNGIKIDCRESDKINWLAASFDDTLKTKVKDFNNVLHNVTIDEFDIMYNELKEYYNKLTSDKWLLNELVNNTSDYEELSNIFWRKAIYDEDGMNIIDYEYNDILEV